MLALTLTHPLPLPSSSQPATAGAGTPPPPSSVPSDASRPAPTSDGHPIAGNEPCNPPWPDL